MEPNNQEKSGHDYENVQRIFMAASEMDPSDERDRFVTEACGENERLRDYITALLQKHDRAESAGDGETEEMVEEDLLVPGSLLADRYRIVSLLGSGGMGEVYRADDLKLKQPVALKLLPKELSGNQKLLDALVNEVRQARLVSHRHVCRVHDIGEADDRTFLSMEFIEGEDLRILLQRIGHLPLDKAIQLGKQLCEGVQAGHSENVVHLDLKPANLMVDRRGNLRITDFGLARLASELGGKRQLSGTPAYMAPEQLLQGECSPKSDLYAVGLILYEMLSGRRAVSGQGVEDYRQQHRQGLTLRPLSELVPGIDSRIEEIIGSCLASDPNERPVSLSDVKKVLESANNQAVGRSASHSGKSLSGLMFTDLVGSVRLQQELGTEAYTRFVARHDELFYQCLSVAPDAEILNETGDGFLVRFADPSETVKAALRLQYLLHNEICEGQPMRLRIGLHMGIVTEMEERNQGKRRAVGMAINLAARVMDMGDAGQILMTRSVYDEARQFVRTHPPVPGAEEDALPGVEWKAHGLYQFKGKDEPLEIFEAGVPGIAPLLAPAGADKAERVGDRAESQTSAASATSEDSAESVRGSDVFISFAAVDDRPLSQGQAGWISQFHRNLETRIEQLSGESIKVVQRPVTDDDDTVHMEVLDNVPEMKAMVSVVSPPFVKNKTCAKEVEAFWKNATDAGNLRLDDRTRLLKVVKTPVMEEDMPAPLDEVLSDLLSFDFFSVDPDTGRLWEFDETFGAEARRRYYERVYDLAYDLCHILRAFQKGGAPAARSEEGQTIFLAETTRDLHGARDRLRRELQERGHIVLPDRPLPLNGPELRTVVNDCLERSVASIHFVGARYGVIPEEAEHSLVELQNRLAADHVQLAQGDAGSFSRFIWLPPDRKDVEGRQSEFIRQLVEDPHAQLGADLIEDSLEEFKDIVIEELMPKEADETVDVLANDGKKAARIYLICDPADEEAVEPLEDYLFDQGFEVTTPHFDGDEAAIADSHRQNLVHCDAALIYYGAASKGWVETKLMDLAQARGYGRKTPILAKIVYVAPPFDRRKDRFRTHEAEVIRPESWDPGLLLPFVDSVKSQTAAVSS